MARTAALIVSVALTAEFTASGARADTNRTSSLSWVSLPGAESCGSASPLARAVEDRLQRHALVSPSQADVSIEGRADRRVDPPRWHAVVELRDRSGAVLGTRELESGADDCGPLRDSVALAIALMIDPDAVLRPAPPPPKPRVVVQRISLPVPVAAAPAPVWRVAPTASVALGAGFLPSPAVGILVGVTVSPPRFWAVEAFGGAWGSQTVSTSPVASTRFTVAYGGLALCPFQVESASHVALHVCAGGEFGEVRSASRGFTAARPGSGGSLDVIASAHLLLPVVDRVGIRVGGEVGTALFREQFVYTDAMTMTQEIFGRSLVTAAADLGAVVTLP